jgi:hypothetical protein
MRGLNGPSAFKHQGHQAHQAHQGGAFAFLNLCLGSPSFELKPGEVIYAGTWNLAGDDLGPDLAMAPARAWLKGPAAEQLQPAVYRNGSRGSCHAFPMSYALEIPGAPFAPDYHWGSLAQPKP